MILNLSTHTAQLYLSFKALAARRKKEWKEQKERNVLKISPDCQVN